MSESESAELFEDRIEEDSSPQIPPEQRVLRTQAYDKSVGDLVSMVESGDIVLDPDYQRNYIWENPKASLLIESFLLNVPIPIIYVSEEEDGKWSVVDGLQRLASLRRFFSGEFKLSKLEVLQELNGLTFQKLPPKSQRLLKNGILRIIVILQESHPEIKYDIFQRLNRGSIKLNEQELRNCLYRGALTSKLREFRSNPTLLAVFGLREPHKRFLDEELVLRCLAMADAFDPTTGTLPSYPNKMKTFLNSYMERSRAWDDSEIDQRLEKCLQVMATISSVFGSPAFRRPLPNSVQNDTRLNRALMDAIFASFWHLDASGLLSRRGDVAEIVSSLAKQNSNFSDALIYGTSDKKKVELRVSLLFSSLKRHFGS